jgi:hypothetical protein
MKQESHGMAAKFFVAMAFFLSLVFNANAQDSTFRRCLLWDEPYNYSIGLTYGWSNASNAIKGIEWRCRWFGIDLEFDKSFYEINPQKYYLKKELHLITIVDGQEVFLEIKNDRLGSIGYYMIVPSAHFRFFSLGLGVGCSHYAWSSIMVPEGGRVGWPYSDTFIRPRVKPVLSGHFPIAHNSMVISLKVGYDMEFPQVIEGYPFKVKDGLSFGIGLSKTF